MKGIVFTVTREIIEDEYGEDVWTDLIDEADLDGAYTSLGNYDDEELHSLVDAAGEKLDQSHGEILRFIGRNAIERFADKYPELFEQYETTRGLVMDLNQIIHPEVRKLHPGADVPEFDYLRSDNGHLEMAYQSDRQLCHLGEGLILGTSDYFDEDVTVEQTKCTLEGAEKCVYDITFN